MAVDLLGDELIRFERPEAVTGEEELSSYRALQGAGQPELPEPIPAIGPCAICGERDAVRRCVHCGRGVCAHDHWTMLGLCKSCATEEELRRAREGEHRTRPDLDIKWIEE